MFGVSTLTWLSIFALAMLGATDMVSVYVRETLIQLWTPDELRGRVNAVNMVFVGASNELGEFRAGTMAALIGTVPAVVFGGVGAVAVAGIWAWLFPELRKVRHLRQGVQPVVSRPAALGLAEDHVEELDQPALQVHVPDHAAAEMVAAGLRAGQFEAVRAAHHPAMHHHRRQLGMELDAPGFVAVAERLVGIGLGGGEQRRARTAAKNLRDGTGRPFPASASAPCLPRSALSGYQPISTSPSPCPSTLPPR